MNRGKGRGPIVIGITGSIGAGKSTVAKIFNKMGVPVFDADITVASLLAPKGRAVKRVSRIFPGTLRGKAIDKNLLGDKVFSTPSDLRRLEKILHPMVLKEEKKFILEQQKKGVPIVGLEIPLLFETGAERRCDVTVCVTAPQHIRKKRVFRRGKITKIKYCAISERQMSDTKKRKLADYIVDNGKNRLWTKAQVEEILEKVKRKKGA